MDHYLIKYLTSGKAWLLIGSGPSNAMGYPSWSELAKELISQVKIEYPEVKTKDLDNAFKWKDYPSIFEKAKSILGGKRTLQILSSILKPNSSGEIYELLAQWPISVYMTTNYDNEILSHLSKIGEAYIPYSNSEDHLALLEPELRGAVFKLHGDLTSETGLILTKEQYNKIQEASSWEYWRVKMTSVFQMLPVIIIGHSLTDENIKHILETAKKGAGVNQPVCWIAPDVSFEDKREYLEKYRIRVISYPNQTNDHRYLIRLIESINEFIPPRLSVHLHQKIHEQCSSLPKSSAAPGFFVFNKMSSAGITDEKRIDILLAIIESSIPLLQSSDTFTIQHALELAGWPAGLNIDEDLSRQILEKGIALKTLENAGKKKCKLGTLALKVVRKNQSAFEHSKERFIKSLELRLRRKFPDISPEDISHIASDIESSLIGYFKNCGLTLTTTLFSANTSASSSIPTSIIQFIRESSTIYNDALKRQAFFAITLDAFVHAENPERDYLGRIAQGFFTFHALGVYGDVALQRYSHAKETVWLIDSNVQIGLLALLSSSNSLFQDCFSRLKQLDIQIFSTFKLFNEVHGHFHFANSLIENYGENSTSVMSAALGDLPYTRSNAFLEGFVNWQAAGNPCDWRNFLFEIFGVTNPSRDDIIKSLSDWGIKIVDFQDWPGFSSDDFYACDEYSKKIAEKIFDFIIQSDQDYSRDPYKKARPEAESLLIVKNERNGSYHIISNPKVKSPCYFVSDTSVLNIIEDDLIITWQPDSFVRYILSLTQSIDHDATLTSFDTILLNIARSGLSLINDKVIDNVFGGIIDQSKINDPEQKARYDELLQKKYGEKPDDVLRRISPRFQPLARIQLAEEKAQLEILKRIEAEKVATESDKKVKALQNELSPLKKYEAKQKRKQEKNKRRLRRDKSRRKKR